MTKSKITEKYTKGIEKSEIKELEEDDLNKKSKEEKKIEYFHIDNPLRESNIPEVVQKEREYLKILEEMQKNENLLDRIEIEDKETSKIKEVSPINWKFSNPKRELELQKSILGYEDFENLNSQYNSAKMGNPTYIQVKII